LLEQGLCDSQPATLPQGAASTPAADLAELVSQFPQLEIVELVGRGGMGVVYKARHRGLDRLVALKILPPGVDRDPGFQERFVREARALARLNHPNIVAVYDFGQVEGRYYFLMEYVDGANLRRMLQAGHLTPQQAMAIVPQLCDALQFAHEEGIVHRDIKPENILLDRKGRVKIADFGLAKLVNSALPQDPYTLTSARQVLGTPHYMAPEQFERPGTVDHRADIYSLGVVFYEMLTGELPLGRFPPPSRKVQLDVRLDEVVLRTLEKEPEHRYQRAGEVKTELASLTTTPPAVPARWSAGDIGSAGPREPAPGWRPFDGAQDRPFDGARGSQPSLSPWAVGGLIAAFLFPLAFGVTAICGTMNSLPPRDSSVGDGIVSALAILAVTCAVTSCALGLAGIRQIRASGGRYYGLKLALADALAYPLLLLDILLVYTTMFVLFPDAPGPVADRIVIPIFLLTIALDVWIARRLWRRVSRTPVARPPELSRRPALPVPPSNRAYSLAPKPRFVGVAIVVIFGFFLLLAAICFIILQTRRERAMAQEARAEAMEMQARAEAAQMVQAVIRPDVAADGGRDGDAHRFRFEIHAPVDTKTTVWAELWKNGKLDPAPGFDVTEWIIPPPGQGFDGSATFMETPDDDGKIRAGWQINGNAGRVMSEKLIGDPFAGMTIRDSTWGMWTGPESVSPGQPLQLLILRGAKERLSGAPDDDRLVGHADVELRLFARVNPLTPDEQGRGPMMGSSPQPPAWWRSNMPAADPFKTTPSTSPPGGLPPPGMGAPLPPTTPFGMPPAGTGASQKLTPDDFARLGEPRMAREMKQYLEDSERYNALLQTLGQNNPAVRSAKAMLDSRMAAMQAYADQLNKQFVSRSRPALSRPPGLTPAGEGTPSALPPAGGIVPAAPSTPYAIPQAGGVAPAGTGAPVGPSAPGALPPAAGSPTTEPSVRPPGSDDVEQSGPTIGGHS